MIRTYRVTALVAVASSEASDPLREAGAVRDALESLPGVRVSVGSVEPVPDPTEDPPSAPTYFDSEAPTYFPR